MKKWIFVLLIQVGTTTWIDPRLVISIEKVELGAATTQIYLSNKSIKNGLISSHEEPYTIVYSDWPPKQVYEAIQTQKESK